MSLIRKHVAVLQAWACLALVFYWCKEKSVNILWRYEWKLECL